MDFITSWHEYIRFYKKYFTNEYKDTDRGIIFRMCFDYGYQINGERVPLIYAAVELYRN